MFKTFRENRRLVKDLRTADAVHMAQLDEISKLNAGLKMASGLAEDRALELATVKSKLTKTKKLVREQTGADLLVNALIELGVVPKPTPEYDSFARQAALQQQLGSSRSMAQSNYRGLSGLAGMGGII